MSTLTKVVIILQTILSFVLCGIVVTYVGSANNYKEKADTYQRKYTTAQQEATTANDSLAQEKATAAQTANDFRDKIAGLQEQINTINTKLADSEREKSLLLQKVTTMASTVEAANASAQQQTSLFETAQQQLDDIRAEQITLNKELKETNDALIERTAINATQAETIKRLTNEKAELQAKMEQLLKLGGGRASVTKTQSIAPPPMDSTYDSPTGQITDIDIENSLAEISIGTMDGVREDMKFNIIRGDRFICNLVILDVDTQRAVGILDTVQQTPMIGDQVISDIQ